MSTPHAAQIAALEARLADTRAELTRWQDEAAAWREQARQAQAATADALQALANQQALSLPGPMRNARALPGDDALGWWGRVWRVLNRRL